MRFSLSIVHENKFRVLDAFKPTLFNCKIEVQIALTIQKKADQDNFEVS